MCWLREHPAAQCALYEPIRHLQTSLAVGAASRCCAFGMNNIVNDGGELVKGCGPAVVPEAL